MLDDCDRIVIIQGVDNAQIIALWCVWVLGRGLVSDLVHLKIMSLENAFAMESIIKESHIPVFDSDKVRSF